MTEDEKRAVQREYKRKWREENRERVKEYQRRYNKSEKGREVRRQTDKRWRENNPEATKRFAREYHAANKAAIIERNKWYKIEKQFGLTKEQYIALLESQGGKCACCGTDNPHSRGGKGWCVDHCHTTTKVRGILCSHCNTGLGLAGDSVDILNKWIEYLKK